VTMRRRNFLLGMAALSAAPRGFAADPIFTKPIRIIVPASPGGFTDIAARLVAENLTTRIGQPVVVDYRPGAAGNLATEDLIYLLNGLGIETGVELDAVVAASRLIAPHLGHALPSRYLQAAKS